MAHPVWHWRPRRAGKIDLLPAQGVAHLGETEGRHRRRTRLRQQPSVCMQNLTAGLRFQKQLLFRYSVALHEARREEREGVYMLVFY